MAAIISFIADDRVHILLKQGEDKEWEPRAFLTIEQALLYVQRGEDFPDFLTLDPVVHLWEAETLVPFIEMGVMEVSNSDTFIGAIYSHISGVNIVGTLCTGENARAFHDLGIKPSLSLN